MMKAFSVCWGLLLMGTSLPDSNAIKDVFSSTSHLGELLVLEIHFVRMLEDQRQVDSTADLFLKQHYVNRTRLPEAMQHALLEKYVAHPVNALGVVRRTSEARRLLQHLFPQQTSAFPDKSDYENACKTLVQLQEVYHLNTDLFAKGVINATNWRGDPVHEVSDYRLSSFDMWHVAMGAKQRGWYDSSIEWLRAAAQQADADIRSRVLKDLQLVIRMHDALLETKGPLGQNHRCFTSPQGRNQTNSSKSAKKKLKGAGRRGSDTTKIERRISLFNLTVSSSSEDESKRDNFHSLCRQGDAEWRRPEWEASLRCRLQDHKLPYLRLSPFRLEELNQDPFVVLFHDFLSDREADYLKDTAKPLLERSTTLHMHKSDAYNVLNKVRNSKQIWLSDTKFVLDEAVILEKQKQYGSLIKVSSEYVPLEPQEADRYLQVVDPVAHRLSRRIEWASQLSVQGLYSAESFQVVNYGLGGHYSVHQDSTNQYYSSGEPTDMKDKYMGDRLATFLVYLSDVPMGGSTVYPYIGRAIAANKGTAAFWLNLTRTGFLNSLSKHGSCPVLVGSKWITNKWIRYYAQFRHFQCGLNFNLTSDHWQLWRRHNSEPI